MLGVDELLERASAPCYSLQIFKQRSIGGWIGAQQASFLGDGSTVGVKGCQVSASAHAVHLHVHGSIGGVEVMEGGRAGTAKAGWS